MRNHSQSNLVRRSDSSAANGPTPTGEGTTAGPEILIRPAAELGASISGWLDSRHSFSFGSYLDPQHVGLRSLRVINDDRLAPGQGSATHAHREMEILSVVPGRHLWLQVVAGTVEAWGHRLAEGGRPRRHRSAAARSRRVEPADVLLVDLA